MQEDKSETGSHSSNEGDIVPTDQGESQSHRDGFLQGASKSVTKMGRKMMAKKNERNEEEKEEGSGEEEELEEESREKYSF